MYHHYSQFWTRDVCIDCVITKAVAVYVSGGYYTMIHRYDIPEVVYYQLLCFWRSGLLKTQHHGEKIVLVKFEREIKRIPIYDFCTAKTYEKSLFFFTSWSEATMM